MAFTSIPASLINVGKAVKKEIFSLIKGNLDDHESRLAGLEANAGRIEIFNNNVVISSNASTFTGIAYYRANIDFSLTGASIQIFEKGGISSGTLEVDFLKNSTPDNSGMNSIFTTKPSIDFSTASDYDISSNQVFNGSQIALNIGDIIRFDVTSLPAGVGKFRIVLFGETS